jgi:hypothetical protein
MQENHIIPPLRFPNTTTKKGLLETNLNEQFQQAVPSLERIFYSLPKKKEIFKKFSTEFLHNYLDDLTKGF